MILSSLLTRAQSDYIKWENDSILTWSDFNSKPDTISNRSAVSVVGILIGKFTWNDAYLTGKVEAYFDVNSSWTKSNNDDLLLNHEQGHYDITEIFARKIRRELSMKKYKRKNVQVNIEAIINKYVEEKNECQNKYDIETNHYLNTDSQKKWTEYIHSQLIDLLKYSNPNVTIRLK